LWKNALRTFFHNRNSFLARRSRATLLIAEKVGVQDVFGLLNGNSESTTE
jgi:hypothetical protein